MDAAHPKNPHWHRPSPRSIVLRAPALARTYSGKVESTSTPTTAPPSLIPKPANGAVLRAPRVPSHERVAARACPPVTSIATNAVTNRPPDPPSLPYSSITNVADDRFGPLLIRRATIALARIHLPRRATFVPPDRC
jgi:hypothetical protein